LAFEIIPKGASTGSASSDLDPGCDTAAWKDFGSPELIAIFTEQLKQF
jgi:hypothetical protein